MEGFHPDVEIMNAREEKKQIEEEKQEKTREALEDREDDPKISFKEFGGDNELSQEEIDQLFELYQELFGDFALSFDEVEEIISDKDAINAMIQEDDRPIGFVSGVPLSKLDLIPEKIQPWIEKLMSKSFFILALGISRDKESRPAKVLLETYNQMVNRIVEEGYKNIYTLARNNTRESGKQSMSQMLQATGYTIKFGSVELTPGENFDILRIGNLDKIVEKLEKVREKKSSS